MAGLGAQGFQHLETRRVGQADVENGKHEIFCLVGAQDSQRIASEQDMADRKAFAAERVDQRIGNGRLVLGEQDGRQGRRGRRRRGGRHGVRVIPGIQGPVRRGI